MGMVATGMLGLVDHEDPNTGRCGGRAVFVRRWRRGAGRCAVLRRGRRQVHSTLISPRLGSKSTRSGSSWAPALARSSATVSSRLSAMR